MKILKIKTCGECPVVVKALKRTCSCCGHPKVAVSRPYSNDRIIVLAKEPPTFCPYEDFEEK